MTEQILLVGLGGFLGANARYWLGGWILNRMDVLFPIHTVIINVSGCFVLGLFIALSPLFRWGEYYRWVFAAGFLGAYTTFSTYELESLNLLSEGAWRLAAFNLLGSVVIGLIAAWCGLSLGRVLLAV